jgi:serine/threonine protein kinase
MQHKITSSKKLIQSFAMQISGALNEMHAADFSHSDLKPQNVFVDKNDKNGEYQCYLGDFGLAKILDEGRLTVKAYQVHNVKGLTIAYAAPEFIERYRRGKVTRLLEKEDYLRADVYSLGIMLFELAVCSVVWSLSV